MGRQIGPSGLYRRWAAASMAWTLLAGVATAVTALAGGPIAGATGVVSGVSVTLSTPAAGATEVTYNVKFATSASGALAAGQGTITVAAASGTVLPTCARLTDLKTGSTSDACAAGGSQPSDTVTLISEIAIGAGNQVQVSLEGVTNPAKPSTTVPTIPPHTDGVKAGGLTPATLGEGDYYLQVRTSSDGPGGTYYKLVAPGRVFDVSVGLSTPAGRATEVTYTVTFRPSLTGALAAGEGTIGVRAPMGTVLPTCGRVTDTTTGVSTDACAVGGAKPSNTMSVITGIAIGPEDIVEVKFEGVTSPTEGNGYYLTVWTSSDMSWDTSYDLVKQGRVSNVHFKLSGTTLRVAFVTSSTGALAPDGTITISPGAGTELPTCGTVTDLTTDAGASSDTCRQGTTRPSPAEPAGAVFPAEIAIHAGNAVQLVFDGVKTVKRVAIPCANDECVSLPPGVLTSSDLGNHA